jgi:hypothetical protein
MCAIRHGISINDIGEARSFPVGGLMPPSATEPKKKKIRADVAPTLDSIISSFEWH